MTWAVYVRDVDGEHKVFVSADEDEALRHMEAFAGERAERINEDLVITPHGTKVYVDVDVEI